MSFRILYLIPSLEGGGAQRLLLDIVVEMARRKGIEPVIAVLTEAPDRFTTISGELPVEIFQIPAALSILRNNHQQLQNLTSFIESFRPHVIHSHIYFADLVINQVKPQPARYFSHIHGPVSQFDRRLFRSRGIKHFLLGHIERALMLRAYKKRNTKFFAVSSHYAEYFETILPERSSHLAVLNNAIRLNDIPKRTSFEPHSPARLVSVGRLRKIKDFSLAIKVADELKSKQFPFILDIYGEGEMHNDLQKEISALSLDQSVNLCGFKEDIKTRYSEYDLYLHTAVDEPFGLTILEAMAAGLLVISTDAGGNRDILNGMGGRLLKSRSPQVLADAILQLMHDETVYKSTARQAIARAAEFSIGPYVDKLLAFYNYE